MSLPPAPVALKGQKSPPSAFGGKSFAGLPQSEPASAGGVPASVDEGVPGEDPDDLSAVGGELGEGGGDVGFDELVGPVSLPQAPRVQIATHARHDEPVRKKPKRALFTTTPSSPTATLQPVTLGT